MNWWFLMVAAVCLSLAYDELLLLKRSQLPNVRNWGNLGNRLLRRVHLRRQDAVDKGQAAVRATAGELRQRHGN